MLPETGGSPPLASRLPAGNPVPRFADSCGANEGQTPHSEISSTSTNLLVMRQITSTLADSGTLGKGRFLSLDAVGGNPGSPQSWNRYSYARSNPLRFVDPDGNFAIGFTGLGNSPDSGIHAIARVFASHPEIGPTRVFRHQDVNVAFAFAMASHHANPNQPAVIFGHSRGAAESLVLARMLQKAGVSVNLLLTIDPVMMDPVLNQVVPTNVALAINYYESLSSPLEGIYLTGDPNSTQIENRRVFVKHGQADDLVASSTKALDGLIAQMMAAIKDEKAKEKANCDQNPQTCEPK